jgi:hypothetical protein
LTGAVAFAPFHDGNLAGNLAMSFTVVSSLAAPRADRPKVRESRRRSPAPERLPEVAAAVEERPRLVDVLAG